MINIILTAVITFVVSGIGGIMLERWLGKAKPLLMINNIGFGYSSYQIIDIGEDSLEITELTSWRLGITDRFLEVRQVREHINSLENFVSMLERAVKDCERWMDAHYHESKKRKGTLSLNINDVKLHPFFLHPIISQSLIGDLERFAIEPPPIELEKIRLESQETSVMFDLYQQEVIDLWKKGDKNLITIDSGVRDYVKEIDDYSVSDLVLVLGPSFRHIFERSKIKTEDQRRKCTILAESFSRCIDENIFHFTREFISHSSNEVARLNQLIVNLQNSMKEHLTVFIELSAYNFGQSAIAVNSYMGLRIFNRTKGENKLIFKATGIRSGDFSSSENSQEVRNMYINLNPKSSYIIDLKLEENSFTTEQIRELEDIYNARVLTCKLLAKTDTRKNISTETVDFGRKRANQSYDDIKKSLQGLHS